MHLRKKIKNENNKLACSGFLQIHFAPERGTVREKDFDQLFVVTHEEKDVLVKCIDFVRIRFDNISNVLTIPACGMLHADWQKAWLEKFPQTKPETEMAVYSYLREN